jgi:hypothetical protein
MRSDFKIRRAGSGPTDSGQASEKQRNIDTDGSIGTIQPIRQWLTIDPTPRLPPPMSRLPVQESERIAAEVLSASAERRQMAPFTTL